LPNGLAIAPSDTIAHLAANPLALHSAPAFQVEPVPELALAAGSSAFATTVAAAFATTATSAAFAALAAAFATSGTLTPAFARHSMT